MNSGGSQPTGQPLLGALLVQRGLLTPEQLTAGLEEQRRSGRPLGDVLIGLGFVSGAVVAQTLATQRGGVARTEYGIALGAEAGRPTGPVRQPPISAAQFHAADAPLGEGLRLAPGAALATAPPDPHEPPPPTVPELQSRIAELEAERDALREQTGALAQERDAAAARIRALEAELVAAEATRFDDVWRRVG